MVALLAEFSVPPEGLFGSWNSHSLSVFGASSLLMISIAAVSPSIISRQIVRNTACAQVFAISDHPGLFFSGPDFCMLQHLLLRLHNRKTCFGASHRFTVIMWQVLASLSTRRVGHKLQSSVLTSLTALSVAKDGLDKNVDLIFEEVFGREFLRDIVNLDLDDFL